MALLGKKDRETLAKEFSQLTKPVRLVLFTQEFECASCGTAHELLEETVSLSENLELVVYDLVKDKAKASTYDVDRVPALIVEGEKNYGIRYFGVPGGYEFSSLLEGIRAIGTGILPLTDATKQKIGQLTNPVHIQVFVTPTCPHCPRAVHTAHMLALASDKVTADMVMATEFPHLANRYGVMAVPRVVINEKTSFEGALPEQDFVSFVLQGAT